jgi:hypothetical protein
MLENSVAQRMLVRSAELGTLMQRNNVGAAQDATGRLIRYGLMNDSAALNERVKSSDYVGITPVLITPAMVGRTFGVYTAAETKESGWHLTPGDKRGQAQLAYHNIVRQHGGFAGFVTCNEDFERIIRGE